MTENLSELINEAICMSDQLHINMWFYYTENNVVFLFAKDKKRFSIAFSKDEIENTIEIESLKNQMIKSVYKLIDDWRKHNG